MISALYQDQPIWRPVQREVCVAKRTAGSAGGNARYLKFQSGTTSGTCAVEIMPVPVIAQVTEFNI